MERIEKGYIIESGNYRFDDIGIVHVNAKSNACNVTARWKGGILHLSVPRGISYAQLHQIIVSMLPRLESRKPDAPYYIGQTLSFPEFSVKIVSQRHAPSKMFVNFRNQEGLIEIGEEWTIDAPQTIKQVSKFICRMAQSMAPGVLLPHAREVAARVGKTPLAWTISNGHRVLGHCNARGEIALSYALMLYPHDLREYVICHELAHLSEMNHSARFHQICDRYCNGREKELIAALHAYPLPIIR